MSRFTQRVFAVAILLALAVVPAAYAADDGGRREGASGPRILGMLPETATTHHTIELDGRSLGYRSDAGTLPLRDGKGETTAAIFYVAYRLEPASAARPLTFVFNGGPGAASTYLHLGGMGPRVIAT